MSERILLVTGASGHLGQRVLELLLEAKAGTIIAATRSPEKLASFADKGVIVREADFDDPASLAKAFAGVDRLLLISTDAIGRRVPQHLNAVKAANDAGVKHIIYTSIVNPGALAPIVIAPDHLATENAIIDSKMGYTLLRNNIYMDMLPGTLARAIQMGSLFAASGNGKIGYISREDCAQAAAAALASSFEGRRALDITGPEALSQYDVAKIASDVSGKTVTYVPVGIEDVVNGMVGAGLPRPVAEIFASFDTATAQGNLDVVTNSFEELTGHKPMSVAEFISAHRAELTQAASSAH